eukprot:GCRY01002316.1.p1 GENE.GCRY01002316.1~~GCRY01002316.1.p1  ORF type:complete len:351 (+),score=69.00 GCRY01002316.1:145-1053(+)
MNLIVYKIIALFATLLCGIFGGLAPVFGFKNLSTHRRNYVLNISSCFAAGVFLSAGFLHLLPDALDDSTLPDDYPYILLITAGGYLLVLFTSAVGAPSDNSDMHKEKTEILESYGATTIGAEEKGTVQTAPQEDVLTHSVHVFQAILLLVALSLHAVITGLALGVQHDAADTTVIFVAILAHKVTAAFALGVKFMETAMDTRQIIWHLLGFCITTPSGIALGVVLTSVFSSGFADVVTYVCTALAAGTFLEISSSQLMAQFGDGHSHGPSDHHAPKNSVATGWRFLSTLVGFGIMAVLAIWA